MSKLAPILTFLLSLGPKLPQAIAILRELAAQAQELIKLLFPEGLPALTGSQHPDGILGLTSEPAFTDDELALEAQVLASYSEHTLAALAPGEVTTLPVFEAGSLLKVLLFLERSGVGDALIGWLISRGK